MDAKQEEMKLLCFFDIYRESYKMILWWRKIFSQITLTLILPMCFFFFVQILVSESLYESSTVRTDIIIDGADHNDPFSYVVPNLSSSEFKTYLLFKAGSIIYLLAVSSLSTSTVVYATACILTGSKATFSKATSAFRRVWKRHLFNFLCSCIAYLAYHVIVMIAIIGYAILVNPGSALIDVVVNGALLVLYLMGLVYMGIVWQLTDVVSVLENVRGFKAMKKSRELMKGKMWMATLIYFSFDFTVYIVEFVFRNIFVQEWNFGKMEKIGYGIICLLLSTVLCLFGLVCDTIFYFICKSCQNETTEMSAALSDDDQLEVYLIAVEDQLPLKAHEEV